VHLRIYFCLITCKIVNFEWVFFIFYFFWFLFFVVVVVVVVVVVNGYEIIIPQSKPILVHYEGDSVAALHSLFPEIGLDKDKFLVGMYIKFLSFDKYLFSKKIAKPENRRAFFENLARKYGFDTKNSRKWERISERWKKFRYQV
jgi:hypothetical protein